MDDFENAFEFMIKNEGGYINHKVEGDRGGQTYAGIARNFWPKWKGWNLIDARDMGNSELTALVKEFYMVNFWEKIKGDEINDPEISKTIFDFAVNTGVRKAIKLAQLVVGSTPDGAIGPQTIDKIKNFDSDMFIMAYFVSKIQRYKNICRRDSSQKVFLYNWVTRSLKGVL